MTAPQFNKDFLSLLVFAVLGRDGNHKGNEITFRCPSPTHEDEHPSARYHLKKNVWTCDSCPAGGGAVDLAKLLGVPLPERKTKSQRKPAGGIVWEIKGVDGKVQALHEHKQRWLHPDGTPSKDGEIKPKELPLYATELLRLHHDDADVVVCEGEKDTKWLNVRSVRAVGTFGTSMMPSDDVLQSLMRFRILLWPDADDVGRLHMQEIAQAIHRLGHDDVHVIDWHEAPAKGGADDYRANDDELAALLDSATKWMPPAPVDLGELLDDVQKLVRKYVVVTPIQLIVLALWIAHTHAIEAADVTPYLNIWSPEKRSGKTRLLEVLRCLVPRPWLTARTSPAALYRRVDAESPTFLCDESDAAFKSGDEYSETLRGIFNSGFERGGTVTVCVGQGKDIGYKEFSTFCPKAIAGIGKLSADTIADRSISIAMKRRKPGEKAEKLRRRRVRTETEPIRERLTGWASAAVMILTEAEPEIPAELDDRASDGWEPLLAIADMAGGSWVARARSAALALSVGDEREDDSLNVRLLADIRDILRILKKKSIDKITVADLTAALVKIEDAPWGDLRGKPLNTRGLGWRLKKYSIKAKTIRLDGETTARGYEVTWFDDAWARYLTLEKSDTSDTSDTTDRHDVSLVTDVSLSPGVCRVCGSAEIDGFTPEGEPRCAQHFTKETDSPMVVQAVEQLGLGVIGREQVHP